MQTTTSPAPILITKRQHDATEELRVLFAGSMEIPELCERLEVIFPGDGETEKATRQLAAAWAENCNEAVKENEPLPPVSVLHSTAENEDINILASFRCAL